MATRLRTLGLRRPFETYPSLLLGALAMTPLDVTAMYQTMASGGFQAPLRAIREVTNAESQPLARYPLNMKQVIEPDAAICVELRAPGGR